MCIYLIVDISYYLYNCALPIAYGSLGIVFEMDSVQRWFARQIDEVHTFPDMTTVD